MAKSPLTDTTFSSLKLAEPLQRSVANTGFTHCTPIQAATLPMALEGRDVAGQAQTGTGKTAAFLLATMQRLLTRPAPEDRRKNDPLALIVAPTRELAIQIHKDALLLGEGTGLKFALAYGGVDYAKQRETIQAGCDVLIGTPGRLIDYFKQKVFSLRHLQVAVVDEADRMFDLGFISDIRYMFRRMPAPQERQNMLYSATLSHRVLELAYEHMNDPETVRIETEHVTAENITQRLYHVPKEDKIPLLLGLFRKHTPERTIVFVNTKRAADNVMGYLQGNDYDAEVISGDIPQHKREKLLKRFHDGAIRVLVATDVAARGLHIPDVSHVFNYDLPQDAEDYVHRIGRTARLGAKGHAVSFACEDTAFYLPDIEEYIGQKLPRQDLDPELLAEPKPPVKKPRRAGPPPKQRPRRRHGDRQERRNG
jgi:ATP-dependent RNA helicase RhlB